MIYLISDIHGCYNTFLKLIKKIKLTNQDTLICLGDAIDRGRYSFEVLDYFMNNNNCKLIKGNHELFFILSENNILASCAILIIKSMIDINSPYTSGV